MKAQDTRQYIVDAADRLFYEQGFEATSFAHIAEAVGLSRGNFYYHFKTKDEILTAVIAQRKAKTRQMLDAWQEDASPMTRIASFIRILTTNRARIMSYGCPVGTLTTELAKLEHAMLGQAGRLFALFRSWLREQFVQLGHREQADELAMHVLAFSQGVAVMANAFRDEAFIRREVDRMRAWLSTYEK